MNLLRLRLAITGREGPHHEAGAPRRSGGKRAARALPGRPLAQISLRDIAPEMNSAWRIASATIVRVGFSAPPVVNWLPSETKRFLMSCVWPCLLTTPSPALALIRLVPRLCVDG